MANIYIICNDTYNVDEIDKAIVDIGEYVLSPLYKKSTIKEMFGKEKHILEIIKWKPYARVLNDEENKGEDFHFNKTLNASINSLFDVDISSYDQKITDTRNKISSFVAKVEKFGGTYRLYHEKRGVFKAKLVEIPSFILDKYNMEKTLNTYNLTKDESACLVPVKVERVPYLCIVKKDGTFKYYYGLGIDIDNPNEEKKVLLNKMNNSSMTSSNDSYYEYYQKSQVSNSTSYEEKPIDKKDFSGLYQIRQRVIELKQDVINGIISEKEFNRQLKIVLDDGNLGYISLEDDDTEITVGIVDQQENDFFINGVEKRKSIEKLASILSQYSKNKSTKISNVINNQSLKQEINSHTETNEYNDFEIKIKKLQLLYERGMISKAVYDSKINKLLDEI